MIPHSKSSPAALTFAVALTGLLALGSSGVVRAQPQQSATSSQAKTVTSADVDEPTLEQFTRTYLQVKDLQQKEKTDLANATDPAKQQQIRHDASQQMIDAIRSHQLTVDRFNAILTSIPKDPKLGKRFVDMQKKLQDQK